MNLRLELLTDAERSRFNALPEEEGFIADFMKWAGKKTDAPSYTLKAAALQALSLTAGDTIVLPPLFGAQPTYLNLYVMLVGPSTTMRKTTVLNFVRDLLPVNQQTHQPFISILSDVSIQAFNKELANAAKLQAPVLLSVDEVAGLFQQVRNRSGSYLTGFDKTLMQAYDHSPIAIHRVGSKVEVASGAFVNIFAATTPEPLMEVLSGDDVASGLLPRFLIFDARDAIRGERRSLMDRMKGHDEWAEEADDLRRFLLYVSGPRAVGIPGNDGLFPVHVIPIDDDALARLDAIDKRFTQEGSRDTTSWGAIKGRGFWHIAKLSGLFAISRGGPTTSVTLPDVWRAMHLVETTVSDLARMSEEVGSNAHERIVNDAIALINGTAGKRMKQSAIISRLKLSAREGREILGTLVARDLIAIEDRSGKPTKDPAQAYWRKK